MVDEGEKKYLMERSLGRRKKMALAIIIPEYASFLAEKKESSEDPWDEEGLSMGDTLNILDIDPFEEINLSKDESRIISKADLFLKNAFNNYSKLLEISDEPLVLDLATYERNNIYQELKEDQKKVDISFLLDCFLNLKKIVTPTKDDLVFKYLSNKWSLMTMTSRKNNPSIPYTFIAAALNEDYPDNDNWLKVNDIIINENNTDSSEKDFIGLASGYSMLNLLGDEASGESNKEKYIAMPNISTKEQIDENIKNSKLLDVLEIRKGIINKLFQGVNEKLEEAGLKNALGRTEEDEEKRTEKVLDTIEPRFSDEDKKRINKNRTIFFFIILALIAIFMTLGSL